MYAVVRSRDVKGLKQDLYAAAAEDGVRVAVKRDESSRTGRQWCVRVEGQSSRVQAVLAPHMN